MLFMTDKLIRIHSLSAGYDGRRQIHDISFDVYCDDFIGIIGPNGGGKTTLLRALLGLIPPMSGSVEYFRKGQLVDHLRTGYLPQYSAIDKHFPISVYETVLSGLNSRKFMFRRFDSTQHAMAEHAISRLQLNDVRQRPISALSGGELQRVLLARAVVCSPELLVLDEPDTYIDRHYKHQMYDMIESLAAECAVIMVSHDTEYVNSRVRRVLYVDETLVEENNKGE